MSRKKATRRKVKATDSYSRHSPNSTTMDHAQKSSEEHLPQTANFHSQQDLSVDSTAPQANQQTSLMPEHWNEQNHSGSMLSSAVKVKTEPNTELEHQTCSNENNRQHRVTPTSKQDNTSTFKPAKIKRERLSLDSFVSLRSTHQFPTMDLGSHLEQSLSSLKSGPDLTWSQLLEVKNLPQVHIPEKLQSNVVIKTERPDSGSDMVLCSTDDDTDNQPLAFRVGKKSTPGNSNTVSAKEKASERSGLSGLGTSLTSSGNRFSKNRDGSSGVLDLSKKVIRPEIRRVLASKYGAAKRHEEGHSGNVVPNLNKSRSRFTHSSKKAGVTDSEDKGNNRIETAKSGHLSSIDARQSPEMERSHTQTSTSQKLKPSSGIPKSKSVSPTEYPGSIPVPAKVLNRRRFSSSTYEGRRSTPSLDHREAVRDKLQSRGLVDLGSHYVNLLKDSPPPLTGRNSRSPYEESAGSTDLGREDSTILDKEKSVVREAKNMRQSPFDDRNAGPTKGGSNIAKGLPQGVRRSSFAGDSSETSRSSNLRGETLHHEGAKKLNEARSLRVIGRNSKSPVDFESRNPEETMVDLGSTSRFGQRRDSLHSSTRSSSRSPLDDVTASGSGPMIDLNTSTSQLRVPQVRGGSNPFIWSHSNEAPNHSQQTNAKERMTELRSDKQLRDYQNSAKHPNESSTFTLPRSSSRSPIRTERSTNTPPNIKEPMMELGSGKQFHGHLENAKHAISRSSSRSPVRTDKHSNACSPNETMIELGSGKQIHDHQSNTKHAAQRSRSRSPISSDLASKSDHPEAMIQLSSTDRLTKQQRSRSRSPDSGPAGEPMIDLSGTDRLHERRGAPRMKPLDAMIDLNSMENPASPLSPGFGALPFSSFPSQVYRPPNRPRYPYKSKHYRGRPQRGTSPALGSPGFSPRLPFGPHFNYPPNQRYRMPGAPMIDLGSLGRSSEFQGMVSSRSSEIPVRSGTIPKRRHSMDYQSLSEPMKKPRVTVPDQQLDVKPGGSGVRLNVSDLLQLEREEQKYIQDLSLVQLQLTEIRFKMQRMQQDLDKLQSSEMEIRQRIDVVRGKRVRILKDAQGHQESQGTSAVLGDSDMGTRKDKEGDIGTRRGNDGDMGTRRDNDGDIITRSGNEGDRGTRRDNEGDKGTQDGNEKDDVAAYNTDSLGFHSNRTGDAKESVPESNRKGSRVFPEGKNNEFRSNYNAEGSSFEEKRDIRKNSSEKTSDKNNEIITSSYAGSSGQSKYRNMADDRNLAPSELVLRDAGYSSNMSDPPHPILSTNAPSIQHYPITSSSNDRPYHTIFKHTTRRTDWERSSPGTPQEKLSTEIETFESSNGSTITLKSDGTLVLHKNKAETSQLARKRSNPTILEEAYVGFDAKKTEYGGITSDESQQFLGCLEITSTTDEPLASEDDGPKEVLAEKERECLASKLRCDQDRISSTVPSLEIEQDDSSIGSAGEMNFIGHTDAVCCILPYKGKLFSASADRTVKAFDLKTGECIKTFKGHELAVNCLQISGLGDKTDRLFTGANDQSVRAYNIKSGACTHKFSFRGRVMCLHVAFGKLFVGLSSGFVAVIDLKTNECIDQFNCHEPSRISCLSSATEGQRSLLCTGSFDSTITIRDESSGLLLRHIKDHKLTVLCMQVVENILYSGSADTVIQSHNINTGELVRSYTGHTMSVSGLQALGGVLVTSSLDRIIRCFDIKTGDLLQLYGGNTDMIFSLSVIGNMIYTGCRDGRVSGIKLDLRKYHCCKWGDCSLKFGLLNHLKQHVQDHINQTVDFKSCFWDECVHKFPRGKQLDVIQAATEHILSHVPSTKE